MAERGGEQRSGRALGRAFRDRARLAKPVAGALAALALLAIAPAAAASQGPNIVLIQADDQTAGQFSARVMPETTRLVADHGTTFRDYIVTTAQCCPSRASLLTGEYAHNHGVFNNGADGGYRALIGKGNVLPVWLQEAGYNTIHVGKFLNGYGGAAPSPGAVAPGWDDWQTVISGEGRYYGYKYSDNGQLVTKGSEPDDYITRVIERKAVQSVKEYAPSHHPFFLQIDHRAPHISGMSHPGRCNGGFRSAEPDPDDMGMFRRALPPKPKSYDEANVADKPPFLRGLPRLTEDERHKIRVRWSCALASLVGVDRSVAHVFRAVERAGEIGRTVFIYVSDNGLFYGEHRLLQGKVLPYEEALRQPLAIRVPRRYRDGAPRVRASGQPVANIDLAPTILDLAGARPCPPAGPCRTMDGRSLMPLLTRSGRWPPHRALLTEYRDAAQGQHGTCSFAGVRTRHGIYVEHYSVIDPSTQRCQPTLQVERYNLERDPQEVHNVCFGGLPTSCPAGRGQAKLERRLHSLRRCAGIRGRDRRVAGRPYCE